MKRRFACALAAVLLLASLRVHAQGPTPDTTPTDVAPSGAATSPAAPQVSQVTLDEIGERAEDVATQMRGMTEAISDADAFTTLEDSVFHFSRRVTDRWQATDQILVRTLRRARLETLASSWRGLRTELVPLRADLDGRLERREADLTSLDRMKDSWTWTLEHANVGVPEQMIVRVQQTLAAIAATRAQVDARHDRLLVLQDAVSRAMQACDDATSRIADARKRAVSRIFSTHEQPIWRNLEPFAGTAAGSTKSGSRSDDVRSVFDAVHIYVQAYRFNFVVSAGILILFAWMLLRQRDLARRAASSSAALPDFVTHALRSPIASAVLLTVVVTRPLRPDPPAALQYAIFLVALPAALTMLRRSLDPRVMRAFYAFVSLFVANLARSVLQQSPEIEQWVLIAEMAIAAGAMFWMASLPRGATGLQGAAHAPWIRQTVQRVFAIGGLATSIAVLAALLGYLELSDFLGGGALTIVYLGIGVLAFRNAAGAAIWLVLVQSPLAHLRAIDRNRIRMEAGLRRVLEVASLAIWIVFTLQTFELFDPTVDLVSRLLDAKLQAGELSLSVGRIFGFFLALGIAWLTSRILIFALEEDVYPRMRLGRGVPYALSTLVRYGLLMAGFFAALATLGLDLTKLTVLVSAFGLGLGFGMQQIINNFVSGLILLFERPVQVGDLVQMKDLAGEVLRIGIRSSTVRTGDGAEVIIPNSDLIQNDVTNWTLSDRRRRVTVELGVAYGTDADTVLALLVAVARADARVMTNPAPDALFASFGASALQFQLRFWTEESNWLRLKSDLSVRVQSALREARIGIPVTPVEVQIAGVAAEPR